MAVESAVAYTDLRMLVDVDPPQYKYEANRTYRTVSHDDDVMLPVSFVDPRPISRSQAYKTLIMISHEVSKLRDIWFSLSHRSEI